MSLFLYRYALYFAWVIALAGFWLSIFFGEILHNEPCPLCWYQRMALFPLTILLGIATYRNDLGIIPYVFPLALLGAAAALFQIFENYFPVLQKTGVCSFGETCAKSVFTFFEFIDFPILSALGFILISTFLFIARNQQN